MGKRNSGAARRRHADICARSFRRPRLLRTGVACDLSWLLPLLGLSIGLVFDAFLPAIESAALQAQALLEPGAPSAAELQALHAQIRARPAPRARVVDGGGERAVGTAVRGGREAGRSDHRGRHRARLRR
ncbi:hypothetical protein [Pseudomonas linyingensis]|uniref:hypothetical protein n=1 Tax=Pseudomonas linyingensis TaxID=915471 RepID=UPI00111394BB|nr:hypothetical protein [Pseudomonas linyingensis]